MFLKKEIQAEIKRLYPFMKGADTASDAIEVLKSSNMPDIAKIGDTLSSFYISESSTTIAWYAKIIINSDEALALILSTNFHNEAKEMQEETQLLQECEFFYLQSDEEFSYNLNSEFYLKGSGYHSDSEIDYSS